MNVGVRGVSSSRRTAVDEFPPENLQQKDRNGEDHVEMYRKITMFNRLLNEVKSLGAEVDISTHPMEPTIGSNVTNVLKNP